MSEYSDLRRLDVTLRPISGWPGGRMTPAHDRRRSQFKATPSRTMELLGRELRHLVARGWRQLEAGNGSPSPERGRELIREHGGVRQALMATHPDRGGDAADFAAVQAAREEGA